MGILAFMWVLKVGTCGFCKGFIEELGIQNLFTVDLFIDSI